MNEILSNLTVIVITAALVGALFFYLGWRKKQERENLSRFAEENGWALSFVQERLTSGYRLSGEVNGTGWRFESLTVSQDVPAGPGSSETQMQVRWQCDAVGLADGVVAIGPRMAGAETMVDLSGFQGVLLKKALRFLFGEEAVELTGIHLVEYGNADFRQEYMIWAQDDTDALALVKAIRVDELLKFRGDQRLLIKMGKMDWKSAYRKARSCHQRW